MSRFRKMYCSLVESIPYSRQPWLKCMSRQTIFLSFVARFKCRIVVTLMNSNTINMGIDNEHEVMNQTYRIDTNKIVIHNTEIGLEIRDMLCEKIMVPAMRGM
jgi:hypothetical protein